MSFFVLSFISLFIALGLCCFIIAKILSKDDFSLQSLGGIVSALATFLTTLLVLPKMIGEYLYPNHKREDEDKEILNYIAYLRDKDFKEHELDSRIKTSMDDELKSYTQIETKQKSQKRKRLTD